VGGDSGGPLFDLEGRVVGIHSRIGGARIDENVHVPVDAFNRSWDRLVRGDRWGGALGSTQPVTPTRGGKIVFEKSDKLTSMDPKDVNRSGSFFKVYDFRMSPLTDYTLDMTGGNPKKPFDPYLRLEDASGKFITDDDDGGGNMNARIVFRPAREDTYRIIVSTFDPDQTGPFQFTIRALDLRAHIAEGKVEVREFFKIPASMAPVYWSRLNKPSPLSVRGTVLDKSSKPVAGKEVLFTWQDGKKTIASDAEGTVRLALTKENVKNLSIEVPEDHRLLLELTDAAGVPSSALEELLKERVTSAGGPVVLEVQEKLLDSDPQDRMRPGCRSQVRDFKVVSGATYTFDLESTQFDAFLRLEDATGKVLASDDDSGGQLNARIVHRAMKEETLRIIITTSEPGQAGSYRLTVRQAEKKESAP
jgi:hypothetical protein